MITIEVFDGPLSRPGSTVRRISEDYAPWNDFPASSPAMVLHQHNTLSASCWDQRPRPN